MNTEKIQQKWSHSHWNDVPLNHNVTDETQRQNTNDSILASIRCYTVCCANEQKFSGICFIFFFAFSSKK